MKNLVALLDGVRADARFAKLSDDEKRHVETWCAVIRHVATTKPRGKAMADQAAALRHRKGFSESTIERVWLKFAESGDWHEAFTDGRSRADHSEVSDAVIELFREYGCKNQRGKIRPAWKLLLQHLHEGEILAGLGPDGQPGTWRNLYEAEHPDRRVPDHCPMEWIPRGWDYTSFWRHVRKAKFQVVAITVGRSAAAALRPGVMTTRVGAHVGQGIFIDDLWHDQEVNVVGVNRSAHWPLELAAIDFASGCKFAWGHKPELETDQGTRERIKSRESRFFLAHLLCNIGYSPKGTTFYAEHGTAGIDPGLDSYLAEVSGGLIRVERSGILREEAFAGLFEGRGRGNPDFKALIEGSHSYFQNAIAHLEGRKGKDWASTPAGHDKMMAYNRNLLAAMVLLPESLRDQLRLPVPMFSKWKAAVDEIYRIVNNRTDHALEGWEECGHVVSQFRLTKTSQEWIDERDFMGMDEATRRLLHAAVSADPHNLSRARKLSPHEVFSRGARDFIRLPIWTLPQILGHELAQPVRVSESNEIGFPGGDVYAADVLTERNRVEQLWPGDCFMAFVNPFAPQVVILCRDNGAFVGVCKRRERVAKFDEAAMNEAVRESMRKEAELLKPLARRGRDTQEQIRRDRDWNTSLLAQAAGAETNGPVRRAQATEVEAVDPIKEALRRQGLVAAGG